MCIFTEIVPANDLAPNRQQAFIRTNVDQDLWFHIAPPSHNELMTVKTVF